MHQLVPNGNLVYFLIGYLVIMMIIGAYFSQKKFMSTATDFMVAGRGLGGVVLMGTFLATYTGGGTVTGGGNSLAYNFGLWPGVFFGVPAIGGIIILFCLAGKIRNSGAYTIAELLERTYGAKVRVFSAILLILSAVSITAYQFRGLAYALNAATGIHVDMGTIICTFIVIFLALTGGMKSVAVTDAISALLMTFGLLLAVPFLLKAVGGWDWVVSNAPPESLTITGTQSTFGFVQAYFPLFFQTLVEQNMFMRLASGKTIKDIRVGMIGWFVGILIIMPVVAVLAFTARIYFGSNIVASQALMATSTLVPLFVGGIVLSAACAFMITTGDSWLVTCAANVTHDLYPKFSPNGRRDDKTLLRMNRWSVLLMGLFAYVIIQFFPSVLAIQNWAYTIVGAGLAPAYLAALIWPRVTKTGGFASMIAGTIATIGWEMAGLPYGILSVVFAVPVSSIVLIVVSLCTQNSAQKPAPTA